MLKPILAVALTFGLAACATSSVPLQGTGLAPAARGTLKYSETSNKNTKIELEMKHLAEPSRVIYGARSYVVWVEPLASDARPQKVGRLLVNDDLKGALTTVVPYRNFRVFVTVEDSESTAHPSGDPVASANVVQAEAG